MIAVSPTVYSPLSRLAQSEDFLEHTCQDSHLFAAFFTLMKPFVGNVVELKDAGVRHASQVHLLLNSAKSTAKKGSNIDILNAASAESMKTLTEFKRQLGDKVTALYFTEFVTALDLFASLDPAKRLDLVEAICGLVMAMAEQEEAMMRSHIEGMPSTESNMRRLVEILDADEGELDLLRISFLHAVEPCFTVFYRMLEQSIGRTDGLAALSELMTSEVALDEFESKMLKFGICTYHEYAHRFAPMSEWWVNTLTAPSGEDFEARFITELDTKSSFRGSMARMSENDVTLVSELFSMRASSDEGINCLFYGTRKLDLRGAMLDMIERLKLKPVYEINKHVRGEELTGAVAVAQALLDSDSYLLVMKANKALQRGARRDSWFMEFFGNEEKEKKTPSKSLTSDEILLSTNQCTTMWVTNSIDSISVDAVSRVLLHMEIKPASRDHKQAAIAKLTADLNLSPEAKQKLLNYSEIDIEQLRAATRVTGIIEKETDEQFLAIVDASQKALGRDQVEEVRPSVTKYDLDLLNIQSKHGPDKILQALKRNNEGTLCFHGMPGTGKTQLAEYIALQLNKPLLVKRASDLLSKWLGESEKAIAGMFAEAKSQGAVLLLDEADSFLRDRSMAKNSWEVTQVNELLQGMERHRGVFICATNLFEQIDSAALRRFTFKLKFMALDAEQRVKMFANEAGVELTSDDKLYMDLMQLQYLTPGDFAAVQRQAKLFGDKYTPQEWITQLKAESIAKMAGLVRQNHISGPEGLVDMAGR